MDLSIEAYITLATLAGSIIVFVLDRWRVDLVALLVMIVLLVTGVLSQTEALSGFSNPAVVTIAAMLILSEGLQRTGIVNHIAYRLDKMVGNASSRLTAVMMAVCGFFSAFINNTATVAVLMPVTLRLARERQMNPSKVLMPLSFAAQFGGVCTLIGTTTNLLVHSIAIDQGLDGFHLFSFAKLGAILFVSGTLYMLLIGRFLIKERADSKSYTEEYRLQDYLTEMEVLAGSKLIGQKGAKNELTKIENLRVLDIFRDGKVLWAPDNSEIKKGDILLIRGNVAQVMEVASRLKMRDWAEGNLSDAHLKADDVTLVEVMIPRGSTVVGRSLNQLDFYWRYHAAVLGVRRRGGVLHERISKIAFQEGDTLLLQGHKGDLARLANEQDFMLLKDLSTLKLRKRRAAISITILASVLVAAATGIFSILEASVVGAVATVATGCLRPREAYRAVDMKIIILMACLIPLGIALQKTALIDAAVTGLISHLQTPEIALIALYLMTMLLTSVMSNAATAVLLAPLAIAMAGQMDVNAEPFLMAVAYAASTCFITPVGYQTNVMVLSPGGYKYVDFMRVGLPLNLLFLGLSVTLIPKFFPF